MNFNFNVKVRGGKRISPEVEVYSTAVNDKTMEFANGATVTDRQIAEWIQEQLLIVLQKRAGTFQK